MKKALTIVFMAFIYLSCQKQIAPEQRAADPFNKMAGAAASLSKQQQSEVIIPDAAEMQMLIRLWTVWNFAKPFAQWPSFDTDGHLQDLGQCNSCGVYMIDGGNLQQPYYTRNITIDIAKYQYLFIPLIALSGWYDDCDRSFGPKNGQNPEAFYNSEFSQAINGKRDFTLEWDGQSILPPKQNQYRANSGMFQAQIDPSYHTGCIASITNWYTDGYWVKLPITVGQHTLVLGGDLYWRKKMDIKAFDLVTYNITVIDSRG